MIEFFRVRCFNFKDFFRTVFRFWRKPKFALLDATLLLSYFLKSPYRIAREFEEGKGEAPYGETPLATMQLLAESASIGPQDTVYELGCGRGRTSFWLHEWVGCRVVGVEYVPSFIQKAEKIKQLFGLSEPEFRCEDMLTTSYSHATVLYLFGTALPDDDIIRLIERFKKLPSGTRIITISYALQEYSDENSFPILKTLEVSFSWGTTTAYIQTCK